jgi:16S rRNA (cytidine1402-2'-O)-methyltransferase
MAGTLFVVATPIGNLEDITVRALRVLREVGVIAAEDTRRTAHLLARHGIATPTTSLHEHNEAGKSASLIARLEAGDDVALVSDAGTPVVSDPGSLLIAAAIAAGIRVEAIPGPSAVLAALTASGLPTSTFSFLGFPPTGAKHRKSWFDRAQQIGGTIVFFEAPHRVRATLAEFKRIVGDCTVSVARELTKAHEEFLRGTISVVLPRLDEPRGEFTVVVDIGQSPDKHILAVVSDGELIAEFGELTINGAATRRQAVSALARRHGLAPNDVYKRLQSIRKSVD